MLVLANNLLCGARKALEAIVRLCPDQVRAPVSATVSRLLWVSGYDNYTGGSTLVYVRLPLPRDIFTTHTDVFWLHFRSWEPLLSDLVSSGNFFYDWDHFENDVYARFSEDDFINAHIQDRDHRQLITILARHEHRPLKNEVLTNLRRDHLGVSVLSAIALRLPM